MASTAYSRPSKPPGPAAGERKGPRLAKELGRIEPKKLGIGLVAGCCLALLTYLSFARLFAIYSPVFDSSSLLLKNTPPATTTVPATEALPVQQKTQVEDQKDAPDPELDPNMPNLPEVTQKDQQEEATATKPAGAVTEAKITCDENGVDEGFPYARPPVCELAGDIRISPKEKAMYLVNPSGAGPFDSNGEKKIRPFARNDGFLLPGVVEVTIKSVSSAAAAPQCTRRHDVPVVVFSVAGYTDNFFHDNTDVLIPLFLTTAHLKGEVQFLITNFKPWWVNKFTPLLKKLSNYDVINFDEDKEVHCFRAGHLGCTGTATSSSPLTRRATRTTTPWSTTTGSSAAPSACRATRRRCSGRRPAPSLRCSSSSGRARGSCSTCGRWPRCARRSASR
ncbi:hypothetical protein BDA96_10G188300 [Sorghum bicolor]|uniref:Uncharacterized protein n=1 Tax=Sorghum bicolor TaxID=4558 RepID=A0A921Q3Z9_SORBI|nr:hypothetical protein BDA96_10G188300 [Sorghum bicolor]